MPDQTTTATSERTGARSRVESTLAERAAGLGAVFTRRWAAELVLDLAGYTADNNLAEGRAIEPSCGAGAFLVPMIERLAKSCVDLGISLLDAGDAIRAFDLDPEAVSAGRAVARLTLRAHGVDASAAARLARRWVRQGDFLLIDHEPADWVVGNPPYVRLEDVPSSRSAAYRSRWETMQGRADVYVGFIQAGLEVLRPGGVLGFICADRWMKNQYGKRLRSLVENGYAVDTVVTLHDSDAFEDRVYAYPAIFSIRAGTQGPALVVDADCTFDAPGAREVVDLHSAGPATSRARHGSGFAGAWTDTWFAGSESWPTGAPDRVALVLDLEHRHPALGDEASGVQLGIGLATGADVVYLTRDPNLVEPSRLLPLAMAADLSAGATDWSGTYLVNPWEVDGTLVDLNDYPRLRHYFRSQESRLNSRHVARKQPMKWYRTIDRPVPGLAHAPKLLLPDLRHRVAPVLECGDLYPQHNLFWITSTEWDLRVLGGLLLSDFGTLFVETYSPRMAGGALRVTAQYLRRIRIPALTSVAPEVADRLSAAFDARDVEAATAAACEAYGVRPDRLRQI